MYLLNNEKLVVNWKIAADTIDDFLSETMVCNF